MNRFLLRLCLTLGLLVRVGGSDAPDANAATGPVESTNAVAEVRTRPFEEEELRWMLTAAAQEQLTAGEGELELRLARSWSPIQVPDQPLSVRLLDFPRSGLRPYLLIRFDLLAGEERIGGYQLSVHANVWRELPVARSNLQRGQLLCDADTMLARCDVLTARDPLAPEALQDRHLEIAQYVRAGQPIPARAVRIRPLIRKGSLVEGLVSDGLLLVTLKVEALEDGVPDQILRVRNPRNRREFKAKVHDEQTVHLLL